MWMYNTNYLMHYDKGYKKAGHKYVSRTMGKNGKWIYDYGNNTSFGSPSKSYEDQKKYVDSEMDRMEQKRKDMLYVQDKDPRVPRNMMVGEHAYQVEEDIRRRTQATPENIRKDKNLILDDFSNIVSARQKVVDMFDNRSWLDKSFNKKKFNDELKAAVEEFTNAVNKYWDDRIRISKQYDKATVNKEFYPLYNNREKYETSIINKNNDKYWDVDQYLKKNKISYE